MKDPKDYISGEILDKLGDWSDDVLSGIEDAQREAFNEGLQVALEDVSCYAGNSSTFRNLKE